LRQSKTKKSKLLSHPIYFTLLLFQLNNTAFADAVDDFLREKMKDNHIPGLQVAVVKNKKIVKVASYGLANLQDEVKVDGTTVFNLASITKAFTSVAVMQLVEQGKLELSAPISTYLTDLPKTWQKITLRQILTHTSGLPDIMNEHFQLIDSAGEEQSWLAVQQRSLYFKPGSAFRYNQTNYLLVGKIIKQVSGKSYAELISEHQLNSKSLSRTSSAGFAHFQSVNSHQARDYRFNPQGELTNVLTYFPSFIRAGAGMSANASELAYWTILLENEVFFEKNTSLDTLWKKAELTSNTWAKENPSMHPYALGWYVVERQENLKIVTAGGGQSAVAVYPNDDLTVIILTNLAGSRPERLMDELAEFYVEDFGFSNNIKILKKALEQQGYNKALTIAKSIQEEQSFSFDAGELNHFGNVLVKHLNKNNAQQIFNINNHLHSELILNRRVIDSYLGTYQLAGFAINVTHEDNALFITATGEKRLPIFSKTETEFILKEVEATISFIKDDTGGVSGLSLGINGENLSGKKIK